MSWNLKELKEMIDEYYGESQKKLLSPSLNSIFDNQGFARYHYAQIKELISNHLKTMTKESDYLDLILTLDPEVYNTEHEFHLSLRANINALLINLNCIPDYLSHVLYYSLALNLSNSTKIEPKKISLYSVKIKLLDSSIPNKQELLKLLDELTLNDDFDFLRALVNHSKHRYTITPKLTYNMQKSNDDIYELKFENFTYDKKTYPAKNVNEFINSEYNRQSILMISIGNNINSIVRCMLTKN